MWRLCGLTCRVCATGSTVPQQNVYEFESDSCGLQSYFDQHCLDVGGVHAAVGRHEQSSTGLQQVGCGCCSTGHHGLQVPNMSQAVMEQAEPPDAEEAERGCLNYRCADPLFSYHY